MAQHPPGGSPVFNDLQARGAGGPPPGGPPPGGGIPGLPPGGPPGLGPGAGPPLAGAPAGPGIPGAEAGGGDPLTASLANANIQLQGAIEGSIPMTPAAENELKVLITLVGNLAQAAQSQAGPPQGPGAPVSQAVPGSSVAGAPGPGGPPII